MDIDKIKAKIKVRYAHFSQSKNYSKRDFIDPYRDWFWSLLFALCFFVGGVAYIVIDFYLQFEVTPEYVSTDVTPATYKKNDVLRYSTLYTEREAVFGLLRANKPLPEKKVEVIEEVVTTSEALAEDLVSQ